MAFSYFGINLYLNHFLRILILFLSILPSQVNAQDSQKVRNGAPTTAISFPDGGCVYNWVNNTPGIGLAASGSGNIPSFTAVNNSGSPIVATITATPAPSGFAYIANSGSNNVSVISTKTLTVVATIPVGTEPFGVSVSPDGAFIYITNKGDNTVSVINAATNKVVATVPVGVSPQGIVVSPDGSTAYVANSGTNNVSVISTATNIVRASIPVGSAPFGVAISPDGTKVLVANHDSKTISVISASSASVTSTISTEGKPKCIAISPDGTKCYVSSDYSVMGFSISTGVMLGMAYVHGAFGLVVGPDGSKVYVSTDGYDTILLTSNYYTINERAGGVEMGISLTRDASHRYLVDIVNNDVLVISTTYYNTETVVPVGEAPISLGNFISQGPGCHGSPVTFTITVDPFSPPVLTASQVTGYITACAGSASDDKHLQQFNISGSKLTGEITVTAPADFEISRSSASGYTSSITIPETSGIVPSITIYVRSSRVAPAGSLSGYITLNTPGTKPQQVAVDAFVNALPVVNHIDDQSWFNGDKTQAINFGGTAGAYSWVNNQPGIGLAASGTGNIASFITVNKGNTPIVATIAVTPSAVKYGYITNSASQTVSVISLATNTVVATIAMGPDPQDIYTSNDGAHVYVSDPLDQTIRVINTATNRVEAIIHTGLGSFSLVVSPDDSRLYLVDIGTDYMANNIEIISTASNTIISKIVLTSMLSGITLSADGKTIYAANIDLNTVSVIDIATRHIIASIPVGNRPQGTITSVDGSKVYVTNTSSNTVSVISTLTNTVSATIPVGKVPNGIAESADGKRIYVSNFGDSTLYIINAADNTVVRTVNAGSYPMGVSVSPDGAQVYVANSNSATVTVIDAVNGSNIATINVGFNPFSLGRFISPGTGCGGTPVSFTITVKPGKPTITPSGALAALRTIYGQPSVAETFKVSGSNLTSGVLILPPGGFEVSADGMKYSSKVTIAANSTDSIIYIRISSKTPAGAYQGVISLTSAGAANANMVIPLSAVSKAPLIITADNKSRFFGTNNPLLTASYNGFVNQDNAGSLTAQPFINTIATVASPAGKYVITVGGAASPNYAISYVSGLLTIHWSRLMYLMLLHLMTMV